MILRRAFPLIAVFICAQLSAETIETKSGTVFKGAEVLSVARDGLLLKYSGGTLKVPLASLTPALRAKYSTPEEKAAAEAARKLEAARVAAQTAAREKAAADAAKAAKDKASRDAAADYGEAPVFYSSPWDGSLTIPRAVTRAVKLALNDPDSFRPKQAVSMSKDDHGGVKCWKIEFTYAAKNGFGGYGVKGARAWLRGSQLIAIEDASF